MTFAELARERYSVRKFDSKPVEQEKLAQILEAGRLAPTATNAQPQRILVIQSEEALLKLKDCTRGHFDAPLALLVCYDKDTAWTRRYDNHQSGEVDVGIVGTHLMMQAWELGIGSTWVMHFDPEAIRKTYNIPDNLIPMALFPMGYAAEDAKPAPFHWERKDLTETAVYDTF